MDDIVRLQEEVAYLRNELERQTQGWNRMWEEKQEELERCEARARHYTHRAKRAERLGIDRPNIV